MQLIVDYLACRPSQRPSSEPGPPKIGADLAGRRNSMGDARNIDDNSDHAHPPTGTKELRNDSLPQTPTCLLGCGPFADKSTLTRHYLRKHVRTGTFDRPFPCPECRSQGIGLVFIDGGPSAWSSHVQTVHGHIHAPNLPSYPPAGDGATRCPLCGRICGNSSGLTRHTISTHEQKEKRFEQPFSCPDCYHQGRDDAQIDGAAAWYEHIAMCHAKLRSPDDFHARKRKRDSAEEGAAVAANSEPLAMPASTTPSSQTLASSGDTDLMNRIDPRLLTG